MEDLAGFALGITGGAMLIGILGSFPFGSTTKALIQMLGGVFLSLLLLRPVVGFDWESLWTVAYLDLGETVAAQGQELSRDSMAAIIKSRTEAYILDKATALETDIKARVELDSDNIPASVHLEGAVSPYARARLSRIIEEDLGIAKERQQWRNG